MWEVGLCHTVYIAAMLRCVGVSVGVCWASYCGGDGVGGEAVVVGDGVTLGVAVGLGVGVGDAIGVSVT